MLCLRNIRHSARLLSSSSSLLHPGTHRQLTHGHRSLSTLAPTFRENLQNGQIKFIFTHRRDPTAEEALLISRRKNPSLVMSDTLTNSIISSLLVTDYCATLCLPDTVETYFLMNILHIYPLLVRFSKFPAKDIKYVRKKMITNIYLDLKSRFHTNHLHFNTNRKLLKTLQSVSRTVVWFWEDGVGSMKGQELGNVIWRTLLRQQEEDTTIQHVLIASEWLLETIDKLNSYSDEELVQLCVMGDGFQYPLLGTQRPTVPEKLYNYVDYDKHGLPEHLMVQSQKVQNQRSDIRDSGDV